MSLITDYTKFTVVQLNEELRKQISEYNRIRDTYLLVYAGAGGKAVPGVELNREDYYVICDMLRNVDSRNLDIYVETGGGFGETAQEIVTFVRDGRFDKVSFVVAGQAMSAGTILVLSGDEILMTDTGCLGPIDAQIKIGRSQVSANDYLEWVNARREEAIASGSLNAFDATMVAQISPGELEQVFNSLEFAKDLVKEWLPKYKYKNWNVTETRRLPVDDAFREQRAGEIAEELTNTKKWRRHGRAIKRADLERIGLKIDRVDDNDELADVVYRIHTIVTLLFATTPAYKITATINEKLERAAQPANTVPAIPQSPTAAEVGLKCAGCGKQHKLYVKFADDPNIDADMARKGITELAGELFTCDCGTTTPTKPLIDSIEMRTGAKVFQGGTDGESD